MTFEELRSGSEFHTAKPPGEGGFFQIFATGTSEEHLQRFHEIVVEADANWPEGYRVETHNSSMDGKGRYDTALFYVLG